MGGPCRKASTNGRGLLHAQAAWGSMGPLLPIRRWETPTHQGPMVARAEEGHVHKDLSVT